MIRVVRNTLLFNCRLSGLIRVIVSVF